MKSLGFIKVLSVFFLTTLFCLSVADCEAQRLPAMKTPSQVRDSEELLKAGYKRYGIESGMIEYTMSGTQTGTETIYFDRWGLREAKYTQSDKNMMGMNEKTETLIFFDGAWMYTIDLIRKTGTKMENPLLNDLSDESPNKDLAKLGEEMLSGMGGIQVGSENILGKTCEVWEAEEISFKSWVWKGIALKTQVNMMGMGSNVIATRIEEGVKIPEEKFTIPRDVEISEGMGMNTIREPKKKGETGK